MLTLALLRHAKSTWDDPLQDDFDRGLNARGLAAAPLAGLALAQLEVRPTLILCSPAQRTRQTLQLVVPALGGTATGAKTVFDDRLYLASQISLLEIVRDIPEDHKRVLIVGHNPGLHALAMMLSGKGKPADLDAVNTHFPTCALALLNIKRERWRDVRMSDGLLEAFWTPKGAASTHTSSGKPV